MMIRWPLAVALLPICGCTDFSQTPMPDGWVSSDQQLVPCTSGETRCEGNSYQVCNGGWFVEALACDTSRVCAKGLGCVDCDPAKGTACVNNNVHTCETDGRVGAEVEKCLGRPCLGGGCRDQGCVAGSDLIYVVDTDYRLLSFDPSAESNDHFKLIATLNCPAEALATPFSMSIDRGARAWVLYNSGELFWVDTQTGACGASPYTSGQEGFQLFGMGFVTDEAGSSKEKLYIAGASEFSVEPDDLGYIDPATMKITVLGPLPQAEHSPELTGTGNGELYAYHPGSSSSFVAQLKKTDATVLTSWPVTPLTGQVTAWAFAHWGGKFYIFVTDAVGVSEVSKVLQLDPATGTCIAFLPSVPYKIVGAGVSTCAPTIE